MWKRGLPWLLLRHPENAVRAFRTGDGSGGWIYWGTDLASALHELLSNVYPFRLSFALTPGSRVLDPGNVWEWTGIPAGWNQVPDASVPVP